MGGYDVGPIFKKGEESLLYGLNFLLALKIQLEGLDDEGWSRENFGFLMPLGLIPDDAPDADARLQEQERRMARQAKAINDAIQVVRELLFRLH